MSDGFISTVGRALVRARISILVVALTYLISLLVGMIMVHAGNTFAVSYRDNLVGKAQTSSSLVALDQNQRLKAALLDFGGNLLGGVSSTLGGLGVIFPFPFIAFRGWVGGIVSIDGAHASRLADAREAFYYLSTILLQLIPYTLAGGSGINLGLSFYRPRPEYPGKKWLGMPVEALRDVLRIYILVVPLFLFAALWEFILR
jgi:uncharacterized membrane protein SpoIIM required for sporulation